MADGFFRTKHGYTVVQNVVTRDKKISLKAKGLYLVIQSNITMPNKKWLKSEFMSMVSEGKSAFDSSWNELKNNGYLHVHVFSDGRNFTYEYELLNEPAEGPHTFYYNANGELTSTNITRAAKKNGVDVNQGEEKQPSSDMSRYTDFQCIGNHSNGNQYNGSRDIGNGGNNYNSLDVNPNNKSYDNNNSIKSNPINEESKLTATSGIDRIEDCYAYMDIIKDNISYSELMLWNDPEKKQRFIEMYQLICDVVCIQRDTIRVNGVDYPYPLVRNQFLKLTKDHLEYVSNCMDVNLGQVNNIRAYLLTALYNAPTTFCNHEAQDYRAKNQTQYISEFDVANREKIEKLHKLKKEKPEEYRQLLLSGNI